MIPLNEIERLKPLFLSGEIVYTTSEHAKYLSVNIRDADRKQAEIFRGSHLGDLVETVVKEAHTTITWLPDGKPVCTFGIAKPYVVSDVGYPWIIGTKELEEPKYKIRFLRHYKLFVEFSHSLCPVLETFVDRDSAMFNRWMEKLGFKVKEVKEKVIIYRHTRD